MTKNTLLHRFVDSETKEVKALRACGVSWKIIEALNSVIATRDIRKEDSDEITQRMSMLAMFEASTQYKVGEVILEEE